MAFLDYLTDIKPIVGLPDSYDSLGAWLTNAICDKLERYIGINYSPSTKTFTINSYAELSQVGFYMASKGLLVLKYYPLTSVTVNGEPCDIIAQDTVKVGKLDYPVTIVLTLAGHFINDELKLIAIRLFNHQLALLQSKAGATTGSSFAGDGVTYNFELPLDVQQALKHLKRMVIR